MLRFIKTYHLIAILLLGLSCSNTIAQSMDTYVNTTLRARDWGSYPIVLSNEVKGGIHHVTTVAERDAIPADRLQAGMLVCLGNLNFNGTDVIYQYTGAAWRQVNLLQVFTANENYVQGQIVLEGVELYVAKADITPATLTPSADPTNWYSLLAHLSDLDMHRTIDDAGTSTTDLWSADRIIEFVQNNNTAQAGDGLVWDATDEELDVNASGGIEVVDDTVRLVQGTANQILAMNEDGDAVEWKTFTLDLETVTVITGAATLNTSQTGIVLCNGGSTSYTLNLPSAGTLKDGMTFKVKNLGTGTVRVKGNGSALDGTASTVDGDAATALAEQYASVTVIAWEGKWYILERQAKNSLYVGNPDVNGAWRITFDADGMQFQRRTAAGVWTEMLEVEN